MKENSGGAHPSGPTLCGSKNSTSKIAEVEIGRSRNWPKSKKSWPKSKLAEVDRALLDALLRSNTKFLSCLDALPCRRHLTLRLRNVERFLQETDCRIESVGSPPTCPPAPGQVCGLELTHAVVVVERLTCAPPLATFARSLPTEN